MQSQMMLNKLSAKKYVEKRPNGMTLKRNRAFPYRFTFINQNLKLKTKQKKLGEMQKSFSELIFL